MTYSGVPEGMKNETAMISRDSIQNDEILVLFNTNQNFGMKISLGVNVMLLTITFSS